ncbi:MAG: ABC transporter substrate-binding protein [Anaerolineales bacterium]|nr:ABC transporter substrate-binding protein [Anaerolineales bacterium]
MKYLRITAILLLLSIVCLSLVACSSNEPTPAPEETVVEPTTPAEAETAAEEVEEPKVETTEPEAEEAEEEAVEVEEPPETPAEPITLIVAMNIDAILTIDPGHTFEPENQIIIDALYDGLAETTPDNLAEPTPRLAESWDISDDGLVYTFHIRPGVKFASGNPLTAEDFRFSFMRYINLKDNVSWYFRMVESVEAVDELTLQITLTEPSAELLSSLSGVVATVLDSQVVKEHGGTDAEDADTTDTAKEWLDQNSANTGPFMLESWTPKSEIVLVKNPNYWREGPNVDKVIFKNITDPTVAIQMLQTGEADMVYQIDIDLADIVKSDPDLTLVQGQLYNQEYIAMTSNPERSEALSNPLVRQAVILAIDYDGIINSIFNGFAIKAPVMLPLGVPGSNPDMIVERDLDKAKALLAESGYPDGFSVELAYGTSPERDTVAAKIQADLAEVGIDVALRPLEMSVYYSEARAQNLAFLIGPWSTDRLDPSNWVPYMAYPDSGLANRIFYDNPVSVELADQIGVEIDAVKRAQLVEEIQKVWMEDAWGQILYQPQQLVAMRSNVQGFTFNPFTWCILKNLSLSE